MYILVNSANRLLKLQQPRNFTSRSTIKWEKITNVVFVAGTVKQQEKKHSMKVMNIFVIFYGEMFENVEDKKLHNLDIHSKGEYLCCFCSKHFETAKGKHGMKTMNIFVISATRCLKFIMHMHESLYKIC